MKSKMAFSLFFTLILSSINLFSQPQLWEVYTKSNQPFMNVVLEKYESDSLYIKSMDQTYILHQDSIKNLIKIRESSFGLGFLIGAAAGGVIGVASSRDSGGSWALHETKTLAIVGGAIMGGLIGGIAGLIAGSDQNYQIEKLSTQQKSEFFNRLFR